MIKSFKIRLLVIILLVVTVFSCSQSKDETQCAFLGEWSGVDTLEVTSRDSLGNSIIHIIAGKMHFEFLEDSTFTAKVIINDSLSYELGGVALIQDTTTTISGHLSSFLFVDFTGRLYMSQPERLTLEYVAVDQESSTIQRGKARLTPIIQD